jgi:nucleoside-diphosphate-sugar epimerase
VRVVVTGAAGFVGSHVAEALAVDGHEVLAVDDLSRSGHPAAAADNWALLSARCDVTLIEADLVTADLAKFAEADVVVHLAGRPGVRSSWGSGAAASHRDNVRATRRLLDACQRCRDGERPRVVVASSSSVYGSATRACREDDTLHPESPYARAKVAVERLSAVAARRGLATVVLRYFTLYGPRQRPDMAFHRFVEAALDGRAVPVLGDGSQRRSFTFVADAVRATALAAVRPLPPGTVLNVGHADSVPLLSAVSHLETILGRSLVVDHAGTVPGDVTRTWSTTARTTELLGWTAGTDLARGLAQQVDWHRARRGHHRG